MNRTECDQVLYWFGEPTYIRNLMKLKGPNVRTMFSRIYNVSRVRNEAAVGTSFDALIMSHLEAIFPSSQLMSEHELPIDLLLSIHFDHH